MFVIRQQQIEVLEKYMLAVFENRLLHELRNHFNRACLELGEYNLRKLIRKGIEKAEGYGIERRFDIARYVALMLILSDDFDTNPRFQWTKTVLEDNNLLGTDKMDNLFELAKEKTVTNSGNHKSDR